MCSFHVVEKIKWRSFFFILLVLGISSDQLTAQCHPELKNFAVGFDTLSAGSFSYLDDELNQVRIVGYGEDTHGTAEFTQLAETFMKYLSQKHGFRILILETGFGEGQYLNDYIQGEKDDLKSILNNHNSTWRYRTKEFYHLMDWLRTYNRTSSEKIQIYGCEMQYVISEVNRLKAYLQKVNSDYQIDGFEKHLWQKIEENEKTDYYISYTKLKNHFINNYEIFIEKSSEREFDLAYQNIVVIGQFVTAILQNTEQRKHDFRDIYMAENIQWILNFNGEASKALYWAHNAHVGNWIDNGIVDVAGHQLKKMYGDHYFNIATDFGVGEYLAFSQEGKMQTFRHDTIEKNTFTECLKSYGKPNTFLNIRKARRNPSLSDYFLSEFTTMSGAGAQVRNDITETKELGKAFDGIIYLDKTHKINWAD